MKMNIYDRKYQAHIRKMCRFIHQTRHIKDAEVIINLAVAQGLISKPEGERYLNQPVQKKKIS